MHVSSIIFYMFWIIWSILLQTCCHWFCDSFVLFFGVLVICWIWLVFFSKNLMQNMLMFLGSMGFSILGLLLFDVGVCFSDIMLLGEISKHIG